MRQERFGSSLSGGPHERGYNTSCAGVSFERWTAHPGARLGRWWTRAAARGSCPPSVSARSAGGVRSRDLRRPNSHPLMGRVGAQVALSPCTRLVLAMYSPVSGTQKSSDEAELQASYFIRKGWLRGLELIFIYWRAPQT